MSSPARKRTESKQKLNHKKGDYLIQEMTLDGACRANKGTIKDLWIAVPLANIRTLKIEIYIQIKN